MFFASLSQGVAQQLLPLKAESSKYTNFKQLSNNSLQRGLETELMSNPRWKKLIKSKRMAVGIVDLSDPQNAKYASLNGNHMMYAASLPKIAVLLTVMEAIHSGKIEG